MRKLLALFSLALACLFGNNAKAQTIYSQNSCISPIVIGDHDTCNNSVQTNAQELYFQFFPASDTVEITVTNTPGFGHIHSIALYSSCGSLAIDSIGLTSDTSTAALVLKDSNLTIGDTYYILMAREQAGCSGCVDTAHFGYCVNNVNRVEGNGCDSKIYSSYTGVFGHIMDSCGFPTPCNTDTVCTGTKIAFILSGESLTDPASEEDTEYTRWVFTGGTPAQPNGVYHDTDTVYVTYPTPGLYSVCGTHIESDTQTAPGCPRCINIYVENSATPSFTISPNPACAGSKVCFTSNSFPNNPHHLTWFVDGAPYPSGNWQPYGMGTRFVYDTTFCYYFCRPGNHTITLRDSDACGIDSVTHTLTIDSVKAYFTSNNACAGQTVTFTNLTSCITDSASTTWFWHFGNGNTSTLQNPPAQTFATGGTYYDTLTVTEYGLLPDSCTETSTYIAPVTIYPLPALVSPASHTICAGSCVTLAEPNIPGQFYHWSPAASLTCPNCPTTTACPTITTTYTVTARTKYGCTDSATVTVTVLPQPIANAGKNDTLCLGRCDTIGVGPAQAGVTYQWLPATGLSCDTCLVTKACPDSTTTYTLVASNGSCSDTSTVTIVVGPACCGTQGAGIAITGNTSALTNPNLLQTPGVGNVSSITGTLTVNTNYTISGTNVAMDANAQIIVTSGNTLTITNDGSFNSRLFACGDMWQGIVVQPGAHLIINNKSIVEDAKIAIEGQGGSILVDNDTLNDNYQDVVIDPYTTGTYPLTIEASVLTCAPDYAYSAGVLKYPYTGRVTYQGVYLNNVNGLGNAQIGVPTSGDQNTFNNMNYGVYGLNSNFSVYNNLFKNMYGSSFISCCPIPITLTGTAVVGYASNFIYGNSSTYYTAIVGGTGLKQNYMITCFRGVDLTNYVTMSVTHNVLYNANNSISFFSPQVGNIGIYVKLRYDNQLEIDNNTITNYYTGIDLFRQATPPGLIPVNNNINYNQITVVGLGKMSTGIVAEDATRQNIEQSGTTLNIQNNDVSKARFEDILLRNIGYNFMDVTNNTVHVPNPAILPIPSLTYPRSGILVDGCASDITVAANTILGIGMSNPDLANTNIRGIYLRQSTDILVECNKVHNVGECLTFKGYCWDINAFPGNNNNKMYRSYYGWVLENSGIIGPQGYCNPNTLNGESIEDKWLGPFTNTGAYQTYTFNSYAPSSPLYVENALSPNYPAPNWSNVNPAANSYSAPGALNVVNCCLFCSIPACLQAYPVILPALAVIQPQLESFVTNTVPFPVFASSATFMSHQYVYNLLVHDTGLMSGDSILQHFYAAGAPTCMGGLTKVNQQIDSGSITLAQSTNNGLVPACNVEANHKEVNAIYLSTLAKGIDTLTSAQESILYSVAEQCPLEGGLAVFQARALYNRLMNTDTDFENVCDTTGGFRIANAPAQKLQNTKVQVYPNPANTLLNIVMQLSKGQTANICIYNSIGEKIRCETLSSDYTTINTANFSSGIYYYRITDNSGTVLKADKQMIAH